MRGSRSVRLGAVAAGAMALAACPYVGCDRKPPPTAFLAGPDEVAVRRIEGCTFELTEGVANRPFPGSRDGFYSIVANGWSISWELVSYDAGIPTFTVHGRECERGISEIEVEYWRWMRTVNEW